MSAEPLPVRIDQYEDVIKIEDEQLLLRRQKIYGAGETSEKLEETRFGIAMSGGGIRSATINLGMLKTLNKFGILKRADYLSTVSGGGYTGAYVQATLKQEEDYDKLFQDDHIEYMRNHGEYLLPGVGWFKRWNFLVLTVGYIYSLMMSLLSPAIIVMLGAMLYILLGKIFNFDSFSHFREILAGKEILISGGLIVLALFVTHLLANLLGGYSLGVSKRFNKIEAAFSIVILLWVALLFVSGLRKLELQNADFGLPQYILLAFLLIILGFFTNPNFLSFHRFYRHQLSEAFLHFTGPFRNVKLHDLFDAKSSRKGDYLAPYPLINTCLNLQAMSGEDPRFKGAKASDYFLLSPFYCGSKLAKYAATKNSFPDYSHLTLPAATTISAAAVNPGMGMYSNKMLSVFMTIFNARLGFWVSNPLKIDQPALVWWPVYFFKELLSAMGTANKKLNISDGGHIENLAVYELLRRKCRLIIAVDAGADPSFTFVDLENLTIRARNELGLDLNFRHDYIPEECIRPKPSHGYSFRRFCIADIYQIWQEIRVLDADGKIMLDTSGAEIEVLVNYKALSESLKQLTKEEHQELSAVVDQLNLSENIEEVLNTLDLQEQTQVQAVIQSLKLKRNIRVVFENTITILNGVKEKLMDKISPENRADVYRQIVVEIEKQVKKSLKMGTLIYVKSSITAPEGKPIIPREDELKYGTYKYKIYHPSFPHEPTSDQFFDRIQWESYYQLGQYIGADVLGIENLADYQRNEKTGEYPKQPYDVKIENLIAHFDDGLDLFVQPKVSEETMEVPVAFDAERSAPKPAVTQPSKSMPPEITVEEMAEMAPPPPIAAAEEEAAAGAEPPAEPKPAKPEEEKVVVGKECNFKM